MTAEPGPPSLPHDERALARQLGALAYPARIRLLRFLARPAYLEEIARHLGVSRQAALKHMRTLERGGFVTKRPGERDGVPVLEYVLAPGALFLLTGQLEHIAAQPAEMPAGNPTLPVGREGPAGFQDRHHDPERGLLVVRGPSAGRRLPLPVKDGDVVVLGRSSRCNAAIPQDPFLSGRHAEIARVGSRLTLTDLRSMNGTWLDGVRVPPAQPAPLHHGAVLGLGVSLLVVRVAGFDESP